MVCSWPKNFYLIILIIFLIVGFWGLSQSPSFFLPKEVLAETSQTSVIVTVCGNGTVDIGEVCDDGELNKEYGYYTEESRGYCLTDCSGYAPYCGDGIRQVEYSEVCDGSDLADETCVTRGYDGGTLGCKDDCTFDTSGCTTTPAPAGGDGGAVYIPPPVETKVIIQGKAYLSSKITVLQDGKVTATVEADSQANFKVTIAGITAGTYSFGVWAEDTDGRRSITFTFTTSISSKTITTIGGIFIPPTIELSEVGVERGETLNILGQTAPKSEVSIFISSPGEGIVKKTQAGADGTWFYPFDTTPLEEGSHTSRAKATSPGGLLSTFSNTLTFSVGKEIAGVIKKSDINNDKRVNLVDFSILLYNWGIPENPAADLNSDGKVNIVDFSIMLYWWTG